MNCAACGRACEAKGCGCGWKPAAVKPPRVRVQGVALGAARYTKTPEDESLFGAVTLKAAIVQGWLTVAVYERKGLKGRVREAQARIADLDEQLTRLLALHSHEWAPADLSRLLKMGDAPR